MCNTRPKPVEKQEDSVGRAKPRTKVPSKPKKKKVRSFPQSSGSGADEVTPKKRGFRDLTKNPRSEKRKGPAKKSKQVSQPIPKPYRKGRADEVNQATRGKLSRPNQKKACPETDARGKLEDSVFFFSNLSSFAY